jgi:phosphopantothenoylcysteine decarboxylase/phosphopantothenate--cysteine ligase
LPRILITSGPTRQYLDPVRYLTNASSGRMGKALAEAALAAGHEVVLISGPVDVAYPAAARVEYVVSTEEMLNVAKATFNNCDGLIGAAAPCDYRPVRIEPHKIAKTGQPLVLNLVETDDVVATLGAAKRPDQWVVGFALDVEDPRLKALAKLEKKHCDLIVVNGPQAIASATNSVEILDPSGAVVGGFSGTKEDVARWIIGVIDRRLVKA